MDTAEIKQIIKQELPALMEDDKEIRQIILNLAQTHFAGKQETESRFDRVLAELRQDREEESRRWAEQEQRWRDNQIALRQYQEEQN
jgi:hypothetical protein